MHPRNADRRVKITTKQNDSLDCMIEVAMKALKTVLQSHEIFSSISSKVIENIDYIIFCINNKSIDEYSSYLVRRDSVFLLISIGPVLSEMRNSVEVLSHNPALELSNH